MAKDTIKHNIPNYTFFSIFSLSRHLKAVDSWATKECEKQGLDADGAIKRLILGESIIKRIRFPVMKPEEFASVVLDSKLLTAEEVANIVKYQNSVLGSPVGFPETKRTVFRLDEVQRCCRFPTLNFGWTNAGNNYIKMVVDKDILLHGVYLFGSKDNVYTVHLTIENNAEVILSSVSGTFTSMQHNSRDCYGFDVMLKSPLLLRKDVRYRVKARICGPQSWYGSRGQSSTRCSDVTVSFQNKAAKKKSVNIGKTTIFQGQFYEFIFSQK